MLILIVLENYLGEQYKKKDSDLKNEENMLEIVTIYFLGTTLSGINVPVLKVKNTYIDVARDRPFVPNPKKGIHEFIRLLNHESYTIQIPRLKGAIQQWFVNFRFSPIVFCVS